MKRTRLYWQSSLIVTFAAVGTPDTAPIVLCAYLPEHFLAYELGSGYEAPLASPSSVIVGTVITGASARRFSRSLYFASLPPSRTVTQGRKH